MKLRYIFLPFSLIYGLVVEAIKLTYRLGWRLSKRFELPVLVVGNLSVGGTGKTPHVEYIVQQMQRYYCLAVLSRGYGRKSKGMHWINENDTADFAGDEPLQIKQKFPDLTVVVAEQRAKAIPELLSRMPQTQLLILDDAMQHWPVKADSYLMLTTYSHPFFKDFVLPAGRLREFRFNYKRANIIVVSKCPAHIREEDRQRILQRIRPGKHQKVFFSYFKYAKLQPINQQQLPLDWEMLQHKKILLLTGIASPKQLIQQVQNFNNQYQHLKFPDHHRYTTKDWKKIRQAYQALGPNSIIITTEKDATKIRAFCEEKVAVYVAAIEVDIAFDEAAAFQRAIVEVIYKKKGYPAG